jgi:hypothetical protein
MNLIFSFLFTVACEVLLHVEAGHFVVRLTDLYGGHACVSRVCRNVTHYHSACADFCAVANVNVAEQLGVGTEHHSVSDFRMTVADFVTGTAEGHAVQETDVVADYGGFTDDNVCGVVNQETMTDFGGRMNVHAELAADDALEHLGRERTTFKPQGVSGAVSLQALETLEEQKRF